MVIRIDIEPFQVTQDVAVSVAFLITEIVEFAMFCDAKVVTISLVAAGAGAGSARLTIESDALRGAIPCDLQLFERFDRIVTGLSRSLRSPITRDPDSGRYYISLPTSEIGTAEQRERRGQYT